MGFYVRRSGIRPQYSPLPKIAQVYDDQYGGSFGVSLHHIDKVCQPMNCSLLHLHRYLMEICAAIAVSEVLQRPILRRYPWSLS